VRHVLCSDGFSGKDWGKIGANMLPSKSIDQLCNRFKNLTTRKADANPLKIWWEQQRRPFNDQEVQVLHQVTLF
jgi:hypothetical protein